MKIQALTSFLLLACVALFAGGTNLASAHSVWVEDAPQGQLVIRFGEPGGKYETSPGLLDRLAPPAGWSLAGENPVALKIEKKTDHFTVDGAGADEPVVIETGSPVRKTKDQSDRKAFYAMRWQPAGAAVPATPALILDILPAAAAGEFRVYFRGEPLAGAKLHAHKPGQPEQDLEADAMGLVRFKGEGAGLYVLSCNHPERVPGFAAARSYGVASYNVALAWRQR